MYQLYHVIAAEDKLGLSLLFLRPLAPFKLIDRGITAGHRKFDSSGHSCRHQYCSPSTSHEWSLTTPVLLALAAL